MDSSLRGMAAGVQANLTVRLSVHGPGSWRHVGQEREFARHLQVVSGAQVTMSSDNWYERNLTLSGSSDVIFKALIVVIDKIYEDICSTLSLTEGSQPIVTLLLRVPAAHCILLLGEGGSRVRDICARTGTQVHVSGSMPPGDSELSMTGWPHCVSECMKLICQKLLETLIQTLQERGPAFANQLALGPALPADDHSQVAEGSTYTGGRLYARGYSCSGGNSYTGDDPGATGHPHTGGDPYAGGDAYAGSHAYAGGNAYAGGDPYAGSDPYARGDPYAVGNAYSRGDPYAGGVSYAGGISYVGGDPSTRGIHYAGGNPYPYAGSNPQAVGYPHPVPYLLGQPPPPPPPPPQPSSSCVLPAMLPFRWPVVGQPAGSSGSVSEPPMEIIHELMIPNDFIGGVIGLQGANISEIRRKSGARVKIFPLMEGSSLRLVRITGTPASIVVAHIMVISSLSNQRP